MLKQVGKYQIIEKIGVGGFGSVYKGRDPFIKRAVAIKTCQSEEEEIKKRFFREAEFAGNLQHRNITTIYDFGLTDDGVPYIVQEFLTGEDLDRTIKRRDKITVARKVTILMEVMDGLGFAHAAGVIHRDIKPANVRVLEDGTVKIMDFGIAKSMISQSTLTQTGITLGTASYLAPEQIRGEPVDPRTDIFSFGVLAYELLAYQKPFAGEHISTVLYKILNESPPPPSSLDPAVPAALDAIVLKTIEKSAANRQNKCSEIRDALKAVLDTLSGSVSGPVVISSGTGIPSVDPSTLEPTRRTPTGGLSQSAMRGNLAPQPQQTSARRTTTTSGLESAQMRPTVPSNTAGRALNTGSVADVRFRQEDTHSARTPSHAREDKKALSIFLAAASMLLIAGFGLGYYYFLGPGRLKIADGDPTATATPVPTVAPLPTEVPSTGTERPPVTPATVPTAAPATPTPQPAAEATGFGEFTANYPAELAIDGKQVKKELDGTARVELKPGKHKATFRTDGLEPIEKAFEVKSGQSTRVNAAFPTRGQLRLQINYEALGAEIFLGEWSLGTIDAGRPFKRTLRSGTHTLEAVKAGFETWSKRIEIPENDVMEMTITMKKLPNP